MESHKRITKSGVLGAGNHRIARHTEYDPNQRPGVLCTQNHEAIAKNALKLEILGLRVVPFGWIYQSARTL